MYVHVHVLINKWREHNQELMNIIYLECWFLFNINMYMYVQYNYMYFSNVHVHVHYM